MINRIIEFSAANKLVVFLLVAAALAAGLWCLYNVPLDAIPDLSDTQVIVYSRWDRSPDIIEDQVTYPIVTSMLAAPLWEMPVKLLGRIQGSEGVLLVGRERIVYKTEAPGSSRTWRYEDIESVSSAGPFQLTLTTFERATTHYGNRKSFNFQLKEALSEGRYDGLWRRLNQTKLNQEIEP